MEYLNTITLTAIYHLRYASRYTILGLGMLVAACLLILVTALSLHSNAQLQAALNQPLSPVVPEVPQQTAQDITQKFYALLPEELQADAISAQILRSADSLGMVFEHAEFKTVAEEDARLITQHIKLPLTGNYVQVRQFLNALLNAYPSLALTALTLERNDVLNDQVQAQIEFTLYLRKGQGKALHTHPLKEQS